MLLQCMSSCVVELSLSMPLWVPNRGRFGRRFGVGLGTISGVISSAILTSFPVSFRLGTKHHFGRCFKHRPGADLDTILALIQAPSGCHCRHRFGRSLWHSFSAVSGAISALVRAPFRHLFGRHSGGASSAIRARHRAPFGGSIEHHSRTISKAISSAVYHGRISSCAPSRGAILLSRSMHCFGAVSAVVSRGLLTSDGQ